MEKARCLVFLFPMAFSFVVFIAIYAAAFGLGPAKDLIESIQVTHGGRKP